MCKPVLMVDVDGVISLFGFAAADRPAGRFVLVDGIAHFLSAEAGKHLRTLAGTFELIWCTGWEEKANDYLPWALGLPACLPYLTFESELTPSRAHWKLAAIDAYAGPDRPLAWIDDALDQRCYDWAAERAGSTLLVATEPAIGITAGQVTELLAWAASTP